MDLRLESVRVRGRAAKPVEVEVVRPLRPADLEMLGEEKGVKPLPVKKLRERHHALARCLAEGMTDSEAAIATGYVVSRVSILKGDPTFQELVKFYRRDVVEKYLDMHELLGALSKDAATELLDRLEDNPEGFDLDELINLVKLGADRTGHGPSSKQEVTHTMNFGERLEAARRRMIDITPPKLERSQDGRGDEE